MIYIAYLSYYESDLRHRFLTQISANDINIKFINEYYNSYNKLPTENEINEKLSKDNICYDLFNKGYLTNYYIEGNQLIVYSYGPDKINDHATIQYDPTNGYNSTGDLISYRTIHKKGND